LAILSRSLYGASFLQAQSIVTNHLLLLLLQECDVNGENFIL